MSQNLDSLNSKYALDSLEFVKGPGGLACAKIKNRHATALITLHGAHIMEYIPAGQKPVLWMSKSSYFQEGKPIRGGIPVCWPWFGANPEDKTKPSHGFARISEWTFEASTSMPDGATQVLLSLSDNEQSRTFVPYPFLLQLKITVGAKLTVELVTFNTGLKAFSYTAALHSYFDIGNIGEISVEGLENCPYIDTLDYTARSHVEAIAIAAETDRIYLAPHSETVIMDRKYQRKITVAKSGCQSVVVWNPWIAKAAKMPDFGNEEYPEMLCVETAISPFDKVIVEPQTAHIIKAEISSEALN